VNVREYQSMPEAKAAPVQWAEQDITRAVAQWVEWWRCLCVPNVFLGESRREIDLAVLTKSNILWAFEIKCSVTDWKRDLDKRAYPLSMAPARFYYVVPQSLVPLNENGRPITPDWVPAGAGVVYLKNDRGYATAANCVRVTDTPSIGYVRPCKSAHRTPLAQGYCDELRTKIAFRYWAHVCGKDLTRAFAVEPVREHAAIPDCHRCRHESAQPVTHMITCPTCGNKRCPKASDHRLACTGSNAPGQTGSVYQ